MMLVPSAVSSLDANASFDPAFDYAESKRLSAH